MHTVVIKVHFIYITHLYNSSTGSMNSATKKTTSAGVILELSEREKFCDNIRISGRSFGPNFGFPYTFYIFSPLPQLNIGRLFLPNRPLG